MSKTRSKPSETKQARQRKPDYGVDKSKIPEDWIKARELMASHDWAVFHVRKWYFPFLVVITLLVFALGLVFRNMWLGLLAGTLALILHYWNKKAQAEESPEN